MVFRAEHEWARAYMEKKGKALPPDLPSAPPMAGAFDVPDMKEGEPCRRCGSGLCSHRVTLTHGDVIFVCDACEKAALKRLGDVRG